MSKTRLHYIDVFRGLCMLLVVLGHAIFYIDNPVNNYFQSFRMPIFYFISGLFFTGIGERGRSFGDIVIKKIKGLVYPYLTLSVCGTILYWVIEQPLGWNLNVTPSQSIVGIFWDDSGVLGIPVTQGFWFVYDLIWISLIYTLLRYFDKLGFLTLATSLSVAILLYYMEQDWYMKSNIIRLSCGIFFYALGEQFYRHAIKQTTTFLKAHSRLSAFLVFIGCIVLGLISYENGTVVMQISVYGNFFLFLPAALIGISVIFALSYAIDSNRFLEYVGEKSLLILFYHFFVLHGTHYVSHLLFPMLDSFVFPLYLIHFVLAVVISALLASLTDCYAPFLWKYPSEK